jgi:iron(III) transport system permease protein
MSAKLAFFVAIVAAITFVLPVFFVEGLFTSFQNFVSTLSNPKLPGLLYTTFYPGIIASVISTAFGLFYAWIVHRTNVPGRRILAILPFLGLTIPASVRAIGLYFLLHPRVGLINVLFMQFFGVNFPLFNVLSVNGLILANGIGGFPFHYLLLTAAIRTFDPRLEDSARVTGSSIFRTFMKVTLPSLAPALIVVYIQGIIISASAFDYAFIFGSAASSGINVLSTQIYDAVAENIPPEYAFGADLTLVYLIFTVALVTVYVYYVRKQRYQTQSFGAVRYTRFTLGRLGKAVALFVCAIILIITIFLVLGIVVLVSILPTYSYGASLTAFTAANYFSLLFTNTYPFFWIALKNSLISASVTAVIATFVAPFIVYAVYRTSSRASKVLEYFNFVPIAVPGTVYGFALLVMFLRLPYLSTYIYGTIWAPIIALVITWLPFSIRLQSGSAIYIKKESEEAAFVSGASWLRMLRTVFVPMLSAGIFVSFGYVFVDSLRDLGTIYLLATGSTYLLPSFIADTFTSTAANFGIISATATVMTLLAVVAVLLVDKASGGRFLVRADND